LDAEQREVEKVRINKEKFKMNNKFLKVLRNFDSFEASFYSCGGMHIFMERLHK
jgi:hypothetical protein